MLWVKVLRWGVAGACVATALVVAGGFSDSTARALNAPVDYVQWPDCTTADEEFCVEKLEFTPVGSSSAQVISDAVPPLGTSPADHTNMSVDVRINGNTAVYGKMGLSNLSFEFSDPAFNTFVAGGSVTRTGAQNGTYTLVVRTGDYKPHSMTIKGKPSGDDPFAVTKGSDGYYTLTLTATSQPFVTLMDSTKWQACNASKWGASCEPDTAFLQKLSGMVVVVPPTFQDVEAPRAPGMPSVSPALSLSQGLWIASNTVVWDAKAEMNLVTKSFKLPAYGPHYVPTDFPSTGLTAEGSRFLNPAYFIAFIPNELLAFVADFSIDELPAKVPSAVRATIEDENANPVTHPHETTMVAKGAMIQVSISHYSAPNPVIYVGEASSGTTPTTTTPSTSTTVVSDAKAPLTLTSRKALSAKAVASYVRLVIPKGAKLSLKVAGASSRVCKVVGATLRYVKAGTCKVTVTAKPKKGAKRSKTVSVKSQR